MVTCSRRPQSVGGERGARLGRSRAHRNPALAREALDARALRPERGEAGLLGVRRAGYGRIWRDMAGYGGIWRDMVRYGQIWSDMERYIKIPQKIVRTRATKCGQERPTESESAALAASTFSAAAFAPSKPQIDGAAGTRKKEQRLSGAA